jgi:hypothetical protein
MNKKIKRRIIGITSMTTQITTDKGTMVRDNLAALCNDGTMWIAEVIDNKVGWTLFPDIPQPSVKPRNKPQLRGVPDGD